MTQASNLNMANCTQCGKPAVMSFESNPLCVDHFLKINQAFYLQYSSMAAQLNASREEIAQGTGRLIEPIRIEIPRPPFIGDTLNLNNINVSNSTIGSINTGTIVQMDSAIGIIESRGNRDLAEIATEFAEAIISADDLDENAKREISEQLSLLLSHLSAEPVNRSKGVIKAMMLGIRSSLNGITNVMSIWNRLEPVIRTILENM